MFMMVPLSGCLAVPAGMETEQEDNGSDDHTQDAHQGATMIVTTTPTMNAARAYMMMAAPNKPRLTLRYLLLTTAPW
jgi:hypothetical protein